MNILTQVLDEIFDGIQAILLSFLLKLGPFAVALMPALFTGYAIYSIFAEVAGVELAMIFAVVVAFAIETVGIVISHTAIGQYNGWRRGKVDTFKVWLMVFLVPFYIGSVSGTVLFAEDAFHSLVQALGIASPFLTCSVYIAVALARDLQSIEQAEENEQEKAETRQRDAETRTEEARKRREQNEFELERFRIEQETKAKIEIAKAEATRQVPEDQAKDTGNLPEWLSVIPKDRQHFRQLVETGHLSLPEDVTGADLAKIIPTVGSPRTGQNWLSDVKNGKHA